MAASLPMVVTDVGGNSEAVTDGVTGYVVPPHSPQRLAEALARLGSDADLRRAFGDAGRARVEAEFSLGRCVDQYAALYVELVERSRPAADADS